MMRAKAVRERSYKKTKQSISPSSSPRDVREVNHANLIDNVGLITHCIMKSEIMKSEIMKSEICVKAV
jgi:hypothetical protein